MALTNKQQAFVREYLIDLNASAAARRAGYSIKTAGKIGQENLLKPEIADAIAAAQHARAERTHTTQDWVLERLTLEAEREIDSTASARIRALELIGKHLGMFIERATNDDTVTIRVIRDAPH